MTYLCWKKDDRTEILQDYYIDETDGHVYRINRNHLNEGLWNPGKGSLIVFPGVLISFTGYLSGFFFIRKSPWFIFPAAILWVTALLLIKWSVTKENEKKENRAKTKGFCLRPSPNDLQIYYNQGKKVTGGFLSFAMTGILCMGAAVLMMVSELTFKSLVLLFVSSAAAVICLTLAQPVKRSRLKKLLFQ